MESGAEWTEFARKESREQPAPREMAASTATEQLLLSVTAYLPLRGRRDWFWWRAIMPAPPVDLL